MVTTAQIAWAAGIVEGEGCITLNGGSKAKNRPALSPMLSVGMTDEDVVTKFRDIFAPKLNIYRTVQEGHKPYFTVKLVGKRAVGLMLTLFSHLGSRRRARIKEVLAVWQSPRQRGIKRSL